MILEAFHKSQVAWSMLQGSVGIVLEIWIFIQQPEDLRYLFDRVQSKIYWNQGLPFVDSMPLAGACGLKVEL